MERVKRCIGPWHFQSFHLFLPHLFISPPVTRSTRPLPLPFTSIWPKRWPKGHERRHCFFIVFITYSPSSPLISQMAKSPNTTILKDDSPSVQNIGQKIMVALISSQSVLYERKAQIQLCLCLLTGFPLFHFLISFSSFCRFQSHFPNSPQNSFYS